MKISLNWLRELIDVPADAADISRRLSLAGIEVAGIEAALPAFEKVVVGVVKTVAPHPDADKLRVCTVDAGTGTPLQIVCGAPNVVAGMKAAVILPGGRLPDGTVIKQSKLRGVDSAGMLCSARELGLAEEHGGLLDLPKDAPIGKDFRDYLGGADQLIELEITPNRGDCLSVLGTARELGALYSLPLKAAATVAVPAAIKDTLPVEILAAQACPQYGGRIIRGLRTDVVTPMWMQERLRRAGLRCISPVVDVTQYVMLELGQPMHAYDLGCIAGGIAVRFAKKGESVELLDGKSHELDTDILVIADREKVLGAAGIMGGAGSAVQAASSDVFLEAAHFTPQVVSGRQRRLGLLTDAGYRFERGVDPSLPARALEHATQLLLEIAGGRPGPTVISGERPRAAGPIRLRRQRLSQLLGMAVPDEDIQGILSRLGFAVSTTPDGWQAVPPSHRFDMEIEEDLIEEVGRVYGYDHIPALHYPSRQGMDRLPEAEVDLRRLRRLLVDRGYQEAITYSFVDAGLHRLLLGQPGIALANPITSDMTEMRLSLWAGLLKVLQYNLNRQQERVRLFETGLRFIQQHNEIKQINTIACLISGPQYPLQWGLPQQTADFADLKADLEALVSLSGGEHRLHVEAASHPALHPGMCAKVRLNGLELGWMGALHPRVVKALDLAQGALLLELDLDPLLDGRIPAFEAISRFPQLRRDLAVVVAETVSADQLLGRARDAVGPVLQDIRIFDIYRGQGIDSGRKSVALGLILQDSSRTLTDEEADAAVQRVADRLKRELAATIRD